VLYDLPQVVAKAPVLLEKSGVADRVRIDGGSFFEKNRQWTFCATSAPLPGLKPQFRWWRW
jgi:hypothetical protein